MVAAAEPKLLPQHGRIICSRCFGEQQVEWGQTTHNPGCGWAIVNNPMSWGSRSPLILVLGFSKGGNQNNELLSLPHDEVAFRGGRDKLATILETLGVKAKYWAMDELVASRDSTFAFGSLVRCSIKKWDGKKWLMSGKDIMTSCLRDRDMGTVIHDCVSEFLEELPASVRLVVMLGNDLRYVEGCYSAIRKVRPRLQRINAVA